MEGQVEGFSSATQLSEEEIFGLRKGPWTDEEDTLLMNYVTIHGEGSWNTVARSAGLKRTGKSCRLRWLNYLRPDVRRGNITLQEQLMVLQLHSRWGNRWSKIAKYLPGRTDNEIKNYWRTRVQKQAKQLKCDVNSKQFRDAMHYVWMPRLLERIQAAASESYSAAQPTTTTFTDSTGNHTNVATSKVLHNNESGFYTNFNPELSDSSNAHAQVCPGSDLTGSYNSQSHTNTSNIDYSENGLGLDIQGLTEQQQNNGNWLDGEESLESIWIDENIWFLQQQLHDD